MMDEGKYALWLVGGAALLIDSALTLQQRQDVLDSVLYAQLSANKKEPEPSRDHERWFGAHISSMESLGWIRLHREHQRETLDSQPPAPMAPMQRWLLAQDATLAGELKALAAALEGAAARRHLAKFVQLPQGVANELGVVSGTAGLTLCSACVAPASATQSGQLQLRAWVGRVNEEQFALQRANLRALIDSKAVEHYITYAGKLQPGGTDGQA